MFLRISLFHLRKHQNSASLAFVRGIHREPVNSPHKWPVTRKTFPFDDVIMMIIGPHKTPTYHLPIEKPHEIWRKVAMLYRRWNAPLKVLMQTWYDGIDSYFVNQIIHVYIHKCIYIWWNYWNSLTNNQTRVYLVGLGWVIIKQYCQSRSFCRCVIN